MAYLVIVISASGQSIANFNSKCQFATKPYESLNGVGSIVDAIEGGVIDATVQVITRDTDPSVSTSGSGSVSNTFNLS